MRRLNSPLPKLFLVVFVVTLTVVPLFLVSNGPSRVVANQNDSNTPLSTSNILNSTTSALSRTTQSAHKTNLLRSLMMGRSFQLRHNFVQSQSPDSSGRLYKVTFIEHDLPSGIPWKVGIINSSTLSEIPVRLQETAGFFEDVLNISVLNTENSTTSSSVSFYLSNGSYCYVAGPGNAYTNYDTFLVSGRAVSINISFQRLYKVTIDEEGLQSGLKWNLLSAEGKSFLYYYNATRQTSMVFYLPNGTYGFLAGPQSTFIQNSLSFTISGHSTYVTLKFPTMQKVTFTGTNLHKGSRWFISSNNSNDSVIYLNSSYSSSMVGYLPQGNYTYRDYYNAFEDEGNISKVLTFLIYSVHTSSKYRAYFIVTDKSLEVPISFAPTYKVIFTETNVPADTVYSIVLNNTNSSLFAFNSSSDPTMIACLPNGTYDYTPGLDQISYAGGDFTVQGSSLTVNGRLPVTYEVAFKETNVPEGISWDIYINNRNFSISYYNSTFSASMTIYLPNGTYHYFSSYDYSYTNNYLSINLPPREFTVQGFSLSVHLKFPVTYMVKFTETNVPASGSWNIHLYNENDSVTYSNATSLTSMTAYLPNGTYRYTPTSGRTSYSQETLTVQGSSLTVNVNFPVTYMVKFTETNVPAGVLWNIYSISENDSVTYSNATSSTSMIAYLPNGTYGYSGSYHYSRGNIFIKLSPHEFTVQNSSLIVNVKFPTTYKVTFTETNVPAGVLWYVSSITGNFNVAYTNSTSSTSMIAYLPNGTYSYSGSYYYYVGHKYINSPQQEFTVNNTSKILNINFPIVYTVLFKESGLPSGTSWSVTLNGTTLSSTTSAISFFAFNGTYSYTIATSDHTYRPPPSSGSAKVDGSSPATIVVAFKEVTYSVTFTETGLPSGTSWSMTLNGTTLSSKTSTITFSITNGTYSYSIGKISGYNISTSSGTLTVNGKNVTQSITFSSVPSTTPPPKKPSTPTSNNDLYIIIGAVVAVAVAGAVVAMMMRKRK